VPSLRRRGRAGAEGGGGGGTPPAVPWALAALLRDGPAPTVARAPSGERLDVALVLGPKQAAPANAGLPAELQAALGDHGVDVRVVGDEDAGVAADADVVLAAGWPAAPAVLTLGGVRARGVLATGEPPPLGELGWAGAATLLGPAWLGGALPPGADAAYRPIPVHRREDLVLVHGEEPFGLLAAALLLERRPDLSVAVSGARRDLELPFAFLGVEPGTEALAHAFASATIAFAPPVRGWRPAALAMLACGQAVVAPDDAAARAAVGDAGVRAAGPVEAAGAAELLIDDLAFRARCARAGFDLVPGGWDATAAALADELRALG
jgi:hypothetical protein